MIQLIVGNKGKGKTKHLLDKVNEEIKVVSGNVVYLDKSTKHMYELNNKVRLVDVTEYVISNSDEFAGFVAGLLAADHDLQQVYFDSFIKIACLEDKDIMPTINKIEALSNKYDVKFILSISKDESELDDSLKEKIIVSL
ncbi:MAG: twitching motility protein PilT [Lachnospiraceae bacterium]|nr:twitching motility protein PilT [Lachnospiraceae bacterium]